MKLDPKRTKRRKELIRRVRDAIPDLIKKFPTVSRIWLIGSIAKPIFFDLRSDIDIVVDGLPKEEYFKLLRFLGQKLDSKLDLIMYSDIEENDSVVLDKKVVIYEKTPL